jgi:heme/copper-type cytochrome/quinol oxidase subunit 3
MKPTNIEAKLDNFNWSKWQNWKSASYITLHCLIGCAIGDFGMLIFLQWKYPETPMSLQMILAMSSGLTTSIIYESILLRWKKSFNWALAIKTAFGMSFISMLGMEFAANMTDFMLTGGKVPISDPFYWVALTISFGVGFLAPLPYNYYKLTKHGKACH